jgi:AAA domain/Bifunctional DNA primase/polymerase, N-terminal/Primase C terminal 2 (PriCT-2)
MHDNTKNATGSPIMTARLEYAALGWWTFCAPDDGSKKSMKSKKHSDTPWGMTTDEKTIRAEFKSKHFRHQNVGIVTGAKSGIFVIETDTAEHGDDVDGEAALKSWEAENGSLPATLMARSPSGSIHRFFRHPGPDIKVKSFNAILGKGSGVDCKGDGGMVIGVPSVMPPRPAKGKKPDKVGGLYQWINAGHPIADAPHALLDLVVEKKIAPEDEQLYPVTGDTWQRTPQDDDRPQEIDRDMVEAALAVIDHNCSYDVWLEIGAALHHEFGGSGFTLFKAWSSNSPKYNADDCEVKWYGDGGISSMTAFRIGTIYHYADQANRGWRNDYEETVRNRVYDDLRDAFASARDGDTSHAIANPSPDAGQQQGQKTSPGIPLDYYENFGTAVAKDSIIKGVIAKSETSSWVGPPGSGKSALLANLMTSVAAGKDWRGYRSRDRCGVVYFALERGQLVKRRLIAHAQQTMGPATLPIGVANQVINLLSQTCVATIVGTIRAAEVHYACDVGVIVIDTFAKGIAVGGGDENSAKDQNMTAANLRRVQEITGVHIALVGHTGKDETRGARGSNAHLGDVDMMVQFSSDEHERTAKITKNNDGAEGVLTRFKLEVVVIGKDEDGDDITTAIVSNEPLDSEKEISRAKLTKSQRRAMEMLERALEDGKPGPVSSEYPLGVRVVTVEAWRTCCLKGGLSGGNKESAEKAFRRAMTDLAAMHRIGVWDGLVWIAYE